MSADKIPVILHYADYRGDHATDARRIIMCDPRETVADLLARVEAEKYGAAHIEITGVDDA